MYYIHVDCNSYFASCEVATNPSLEGRPVVVANDNDNGGGVILALTPEAKAIGLKRGTPLFKVRDLLRDKQVVICNADHRKYRAISRRIMQSVVQQGIILDFVQYSVDEFFGILPLDDPSQVRAYAARVRNHIWDEHHMPTGCGCSQTYTLAKVATHYAKHFSGFEGICVLTPDKRERALAQLPIGEVWGIGRQLRRRLGQMGVATALDFVHISEQAAYNTTFDAMHTLAHKVKAGTINTDEIAVLVEFTKQHGGIEYAERRMEEFSRLCMNYINESVSDPVIKESLTAYVDYVIQRKL